YSILSVEELTSIFHFPNVALETPKIKQLKAREAAPPPNLPSDGLLLGYNLFRGTSSDVRMEDDDRRRHLYVIGQTGTGKTVFLKNLVVQDIEAGRGICFIDPHGDTAEELLGMIPRHRLQDVIYFNPGDVARPLGLNMLEYDPNYPEQKTFIVNELFGIFQKLYGAVPEALGPMFEQYFRNATMLVMDDPASGNTLLEISRVMSDKTFRDLKISRAKNIIVKNFWTQIAEKAGGEGELRNMVPYITSKFDVFLANEIMRPIVAQEKSSFNFREVMDSGKILLVNLSKGRLGDINSALIGLIIVGKITMAALSRTDVADPERRRDFYLYIDEFQNVTTDSIATIFAEARKYRLNLIVAHQYIKQLTDNIRNAVFGNVGSQVAFRIGSDDGEFMEKQFIPVFKAADLLNVDNYNCYVKLLLRGQTVLPFSLKTYPPKKGLTDVVAVVKEISRTKFGRPREEIEQEIIEKHESSL
ncbi:MAG TPA: TraM recognition domain-containing protein, partial [Patescibacteria group bacterium]|nr:TraM recognition domain-containing protein [Patescibacteria group bacterium]